MVLFAAMALTPQEPKAPVVSFTNVDQSHEEVRIYLSGSIPETQFYNCGLVLSDPTDRLEAGFSEQDGYQLNGTIGLEVHDIGDDGNIGQGDYFTLTGLDQGTWTVNLIFQPSGDLVAQVEFFRS